MAQVLKNSWFSLAVISAAIVLLVMAATKIAPASAEAEAGSNTGIWVAGQGTASDAPDLAVLNLGVEVLADSAAEARTEAAEGIEAVIAALLEREVAEEDIQTQHFNIGPRYDYVQVTQCLDEQGESVVPETPDTESMSPGTQCTRASKQVLQGYQVNNQLTVKVRDLDSVGSIIDAVIAAAGDIVRINGVNYSIEDSAALEDEARAAAVADLKAKAARLAELAGVELGLLVYLAESTGPTPFPRFQDDFAAYESFAYASSTAVLTRVQAGALEVTVMVHGVFEIAGAEG